MGMGIVTEMGMGGKGIDCMGMGGNGNVKSQSRTSLVQSPAPESHIIRGNPRGNGKHCCRVSMGMESETNVTGPSRGWEKPSSKRGNV